MGTYISTNLRLFSGLAKEAESTVLPEVTSWVDDVFADTPECRATDDHGVFVWANLPACGVVSVHRYDWVITSISNMLAKFRKNGIAIIVHANRGQVAERSRVIAYSGVLSTQQPITSKVQSTELWWWPSLLFLSLPEIPVWIVLSWVMQPVGWSNKMLDPTKQLWFGLTSQPCIGKPSARMSPTMRWRKSLAVKSSRTRMMRAMKSLQRPARTRRIPTSVTCATGLSSFDWISNVFLISSFKKETGYLKLVYCKYVVHSCSEWVSEWFTLNWVVNASNDYVENTVMFWPRLRVISSLCRKDLSLRERNLVVRNITFVFDKVSCLMLWRFFIQYQLGSCFPKVSQQVTAYPRPQQYHLNRLIHDHSGHSVRSSGRRHHWPGCSAQRPLQRLPSFAWVQERGCAWHPDASEKLYVQARSFLAVWQSIFIFLLEHSWVKPCIIWCDNIFLFNGNLFACLHLLLRRSKLFRTLVGLSPTPRNCDKFLAFWI